MCEVSWWQRRSADEWTKHISVLSVRTRLVEADRTILLRFSAAAHPPRVKAAAFAMSLLYPTAALELLNRLCIQCLVLII